MKIKFSGNRPLYADEGAAGADLFSAQDYVLKPYAITFCDTGTKLEIPQGFVGLLCARSGLACHHGISLANGVGVIDSSFRANIQVVLYNNSDYEYSVKAGDRIAQLLIIPCSQAEFSQGDLSKTSRDTGSFGSSGV